MLWEKTCNDGLVQVRDYLVVAHGKVQSAVVQQPVRKVE